MRSVTFVVDESGAKGFADNRETVVGELGVVAGIFVPTECVPQVEGDLSAIAAQFSGTGKLHITDLVPQQQQALRVQLFSYLLSVRAFWTYEAMCVEGLHSHEQLVSNMLRTAKAQRRSKVKISGNEQSALLHQELFLGAFGKGVAFCVDRFGPHVFIDILTDRVDSGVLKKFEEAAKCLLNAGKRKNTQVSGFNPGTNKIVRGSVTTEVTEGMDQIGDFSGVQYKISQSSSVLTLAADVLANSVHHHLMSLQSNSPGCALNATASIAEHPLSEIVYGLSAEGSTMLQVADTIFRHPGSQSN